MPRLLSPFLVTLLLTTGFFWGCEGCEIQDVSDPLKTPFLENFDRPQLGALWRSEAPGRWQIKYNPQTNQGRLCVEQARNNPLFLTKALPRDVIVEFDAYAQEDDGDVKIELFTDGRFHATGYVLVHGGWHNALSIIDRLGEHNRDCRNNEGNQRVNCRRWTRKEKVIRNKRYAWKIVRKGEHLRWYLNGKLFLHYHDPHPLEGKTHRFLAFSNWIANVCYDNLRIREATEETSQATQQPSPEPRLTPSAPTPAPQAPQQPAPAPDPSPAPPPAPRAPLSAPRMMLAPSVLRPAPTLQPHQPLQPNQPLRLNPSLRLRNDLQNTRSGVHQLRDATKGGRLAAPTAPPQQR